MQITFCTEYPTNRGHDFTVEGDVRDVVIRCQNDCGIADARRWRYTAVEQGRGKWKVWRDVR